MRDDAESQELESGAFHPLHPRYLKLLRARGAIAALVILCLAGIADFLVLPEVVDGWMRGPAFGAVAALALVALLLVPRRRYRAWGRALVGDELHIRHGLWLRMVTVVPFGRVQHIDVAHGPLERLFGLATLILHTAGTRGAAVPLPGLSPDEAEALRDRIRAEIRQDLL